jgi:hypothetical protein
MANEIHYNHTTGKNLYFCAFQPDGNVFLTGGASDETWGTDGRDADDYDEAMTEDGAGGHYVGTFDNSIAAGVYHVTVFLRAGANPADTDRPLGQGVIYWDGTAEINIFTLDTSINDDVIGADGDTLETLSDQLDGLSAEDSKVLNVYGQGE